MNPTPPIVSESLTTLNMPTAIRAFLRKKDGTEDLEWAYEQDFQNKKPNEAS